MRNFKLQSDSKSTYKHISERNIIQLIHYVCKMALKCQKIARKVAKNSYEVQPLAKMLLNHL